MTIESVSTEMDAVMETGVEADVLESDGVGSERPLVFPPIAGRKTLAASLTVSPSSATISVGSSETQQLTCEMTDEEGRTYDVTKEVVWSSADTDTATVDDEGLVSPVAEGGPINIQAALHGQTDTSAITVSA